MQLILNQFNPWWQGQQVPAPLLGRPRQILPTLYPALSLRQMTFITGLRRVGKTTLIFQLDEIQKLSQWPEQAKILYDLYPNLKITLSGSANIIMTVKSRESLAGRFFDYVIDPHSGAKSWLLSRIQKPGERPAI
jgi:predicted AAA+ superfamily ATPase